MQKTKINIYQNYHDTQKEIEKLEEKRAGLRKKIVKDLPAGGKQFDFGSFKWGVIKEWEYSNEVSKAEDRLAIQKENEIAKGVAKPIENKELIVDLK